MFKWELSNVFSFFILSEAGYKIPVSSWSNYHAYYLSQFSILNELVDNGFASFSSDSCDVEIIEILSLSDFDKQILFLPANYPYEIYIQSDGQLNQNSFKFKYGFYDFLPNGNQFKVNRKGPLIKIEDREYFLSKNQYLICEALDNFNSLPVFERTIHNNLKCFSDIKNLSSNASALLDFYLQSQNVFHPDKIKIDIDFKNGIFEIIPNIGLENQKDFINIFDRFTNVKDVYAIPNVNGTTTRVLIDQIQKKELEKIKSIRKITDANEINEIVEQPAKIFDDETTDFSIFYSDRVKEIGLYKPKFYPFVCPYKSEWIPGIAIKDRIDGEKRIYFKSLNDLALFENLKNTAQKDGNEIFLWHGTEISIHDADRFIFLAKKQLTNPIEPIQIERSENEIEVLIIKENAEFLEYVESIEKPTEIIHKFYKIENLNPSADLKQHQVEGIAWLQSLYKKNLSGCLLADDMGLGKTLQILYFIEWHSQYYNNSKPYLIVAPVTLLENWENEYRKFFSPKSLYLHRIYGRIDLSKKFDITINKSEALKFQYKHIILTNYETLREYQAVFGLVDFAIVVLDEAQKIKTPGTLITNVCKALKADFRIAMTGTPVENTLVDLWCIMDFSVPGLLDDAKVFSKEFQNPLKNDDTNLKELGETLRNKIGVFIKRRLKTDVAKDLPLKIEHKELKYKKEMPSIQFERYKVQIELAQNINLTGIDRRNQILKSLWAIRDISDHPFLVDSQILNYNTEELVSSSAKLQVLCTILDEVRNLNEKAIVFADRKETQKLLQKVIFDLYKIFPSILNGETPSTKKSELSSKMSRQQTIDRFQSEEGFNVIIMSQLSAGVGLNVTSANHVIHFTRHWNPAKESQATDRAYRIGQLKDVHVYYPMSIFPSSLLSQGDVNQKSFDEILDEFLSKKTLLASSTLFPTDQAEVNPEEIFGTVFGFNTASKSIPLTIKEVDKLNPNLFEAFIAALYKEKGYNVFLTPNSNDKGTDVVAISKEESFLIQTKQSKSIVGLEAIQEIYAAKNYYESKFNHNFKLAVITNNDFSQSAVTLANNNNVVLLNRKRLIELIDSVNILLQDVYKIESHRMKNI